jgi:hypothetical protein
MNKKSIFACGIIVGVVLTVIFSPVYRNIYFKAKEKTLWASSDEKKLKKTAHEIINYPNGVDTLAAIFIENRYGPPAPESQLIGLEVLDGWDYYFGGFFVLSEAMHSGKSQAVRLKAVEMYEENLIKAFRVMTVNTISYLHKETDDVVLSRKLDLLCKHLQMDRQMIENHLQQEGIDAVEDIFWNRLKELPGNITESEIELDDLKEQP